MNTIYLDFDNTIVESNKRIIDILNNKYKISKSEKDLNDYALRGDIKPGFTIADAKIDELMTSFCANLADDIAV